ncbi:cytochrome c peroxidase [Sorangium cellulosum]|uniref:Cytochrome C peroxidase n=2 Tax=Sorangium cellulosum TaxID=56 RepID=S4XJ81_SORCE|nr:cytochrome c peroxidase [Sorangium cellulosum]AGP32584.1 cytochrome C peroxidase [Sorangium cellulosum So0157-2]
MDASIPGVPAPGEILADKYRVERVLGRGGMGVVLAAEHLALRQPVALKLLLPSCMQSASAVERFLREARAAASLQGSHVVRVLDAGLLDAGTPYLVMERLTGHDLREVLRQRDHLPIDEAVDLVLQACEAIAEAHARGIVHRDLKPANLFLARDERGVALIKVLDFGLSKCAADDEAYSLTSPNLIAGSIPYMAPEQALGLKWADARADIWALGVVLYELITGRRPFEAGRTPESLLASHDAPPAAVSAWGIDAPAGLESAILRCLEKDRHLRPQTIAELAQAIAPFGTPAARASVERIRRCSPPRDLCEPSLEPTEPLSPARAGRARPGDEGATALLPHASAAQRTASDAPPRAHRSVSPVVTSAAGAGAPGPRLTADASAFAPARPRRGSSALLAFAVAAAAALAWALSRMAPPEPTPAEIAPERLESFAPLPTGPTQPLDPTAAAQIRLGRMLFQDPRLSGHHDVACTSCHPLDTWGVDRRKLSRGSEGREPPRNTLSIYNIAGYFAFLWDGRQGNLVEQAKEVLLSRNAMASTPEGIEAALRSSEGYARAFALAFPEQRDAVTFHNVAQALAAFEATLFTRSRWDAFLEGEKTALSGEEKAGFNAFVDTGCISCHFGPDIGATMYQKAGLVKPWPNTKDRGRYEITRRGADWMVFRVPSLRNVAQTGPYFHDGSVSSLEEAVRMMARHQLGKELRDREVYLIVRWLGSLTGEIPRADIELDEASRAIVTNATSRAAP